MFRDCVVKLAVVGVILVAWHSIISLKLSLLKFGLAKGTISG